tara:strand:- start:155 stop:322 length:168 start_codon:yes stop_codon:yes gene_type:complete
MTTPQGRNHIIKKLGRCATVSELARVWAGVAVEYQHEETVLTAKDDRKEALGAGA